MQSVDLLAMVAVVDVCVVIRRERKETGQIDWQCMVHTVCILHLDK